MKHSSESISTVDGSMFLSTPLKIQSNYRAIRGVLCAVNIRGTTNFIHFVTLNQNHLNKTWVENFEREKKGGATREEAPKDYDTYIHTYITICFCMREIFFFLF
jgi:hypothetical protein